MRVVIVGGASGAKIAQDIFTLNGVEIAGFMDNYVPEEDRHQLSAPVLGKALHNLEFLGEPDVEYFVATGDNVMRRLHVEGLSLLIDKCPVSAIHPDAVISHSATIGDGVLVMPGAKINAYAKVGLGAIINTGAIIEHDNSIHEFAQIGPGVTLGGCVVVEECAFVGLGADVIPHVTVGEGAVVAAGATVIGDVAPYTMVAGVPAVKKKDLK